MVQAVVYLEDGVNRVLNIIKAKYGLKLYREFIVLNKKTEEKDVREIISQMIFAEAGYIEKCWDELVGRKENIPVLLAMARGEKSIYPASSGKNVNVSRSLKNMLNTGLVEKDISGYRISDPLLNKWIQDNIINKT